MTGVRGTTGRAAKWMRYIARALALIWVGSCTVVVGFSALLLIAFEPLGGPIDPSLAFGVFLLIVPFILLFWASAVVPWRWEAVRGVVLVVEGLLVFVALPLLLEDLLVGLPGALPPLVAGFLFLASWWRLRRAGIAQNR